jgi:hypothetical protein
MVFKGQQMTKNRDAISITGHFNFSSGWQPFY